MNELTKFLVESVIGTEFDKPKTSVALFGGGFKPPTKGHLDVVNQGIKQNPEVSEVKILVGGGTRNGFTQDQAVKIWELYNDIGFIKKPATIIPVSSPFTYYKEYLKDNPDDQVYVFIGSRPDDEGDQKDVKQRSEFVKKYSDNVIPVEVSTGGGVSGTMARELFKTDLDGFRNMFPENLLDQDFDKILNILNNKSTNTTQKPTSTKTEPLPPLNENATYSSKIDYKQQIKDLTKHMIKKGMNILPLPRVIFKHGDQENASQFLGKTAYYSPSDMTVVLYTEGRHPKDIVRSFAHEMVHHIQNIEDRLENISTTNTMEDDNLNDIEREAYTKGNMTFRNWTDSLDGEEVTSLNEGPQFGVLYHFTEYLLDILDDDILRGPISLTRSLNSYVTEWLGDQPYFILDKDKLRTKYKIRPYKDTSDNPDYEEISQYDEMEEVINTDVTNLSKYIIKVVLPEPNEEYEDVLKEKGIPYEIDKPLNEAIVGEKIECDNCGWSWNIVDGGDDLYICHKCDHDNEPESGDPFGLKAYARELVNETFKKSVTIDMNVVNAALEDGIFTDKETDESAIAIIDAAPQGKVPHPVFLDFYAKYDKYFGEENDERILDEFGLKQILTNVLNLPEEDIQTVINHYNTTDQDSVEWFEQHDNEEEKEEEFNIPGFDSSQDDYESVVNYRRKQLTKSLEEQKEVRIFTTNCGCDKT